jgi:hypothetical protein
MTAFNKLRGDPKYIAIVYAQYLAFDEYSNVSGEDRATYDNARSLYASFLPREYASMDPASVNAYVSQGSSGQVP